MVLNEHIHVGAVLNTKLHENIFGSVIPQGPGGLPEESGGGAWKSLKAIRRGGGGDNRVECGATDGGEWVEWVGGENERGKTREGRSWEVQSGHTTALTHSLRDLESSAPVDPGRISSFYKTRGRESAGRGARDLYDGGLKLTVP